MNQEDIFEIFREEYPEFMNTLDKSVYEPVEKEYIFGFVKCPCCHKIVKKTNYCSKCGKRLKPGKVVNLKTTIATGNEVKS